MVGHVTLSVLLLGIFLIKVKNRRRRRKCLFSLMYKFLSGSCLFVVCSKNPVSLPWHMDQANYNGFKFFFFFFNFINLFYKYRET